MTSLSETNSFVVVWSAFKWIKVRESKFRLDWWGSGIDWGEWGDAAVKRMAFVRSQYLWLATRQFLAQNFQKEGTTAVMQNMRKQTSNVHVNKSRVKKNSGILFTRFQDKTKKSFACITKIDLGWVKVISLYKLLQLETSIRSLISQKNNFDTWKKIIEPLVK